MDEKWMQWACGQLDMMKKELDRQNKEQNKEAQFRDNCLDYVAGVMGGMGIKKLVWADDDGTEIYSEDLTKRKTYPKLKLAAPDTEPVKPKRSRKK